MNINTFSAAVLLEINKNLKIVDLKIPTLKKGQVLVKIIYSGICRSQIMEITGGRDNKKWLPHLLGHEASGIVSDIGPGVKKVKKGDEVILSWIKSKGIDSEPIKFFHKKKKINAGKVTTFSNFSVVSENRVTKKPKNISLKNSVFLGCAFSTGMGMILKEIDTIKNMNVVLIGLGGIGLGALIALKYRKIKNIIVIDINKKKRDLAKRFGVKDFFSSINDLTLKRVNDKFKKGVDLCIESAGDIKTIEYGLKLIHNSGRIHFASHPNNKLKLNIDPHELILGKKITGSWGGSVDPDIDFKKFSKILKKMKFNSNIISSKVYNLENINSAIKEFKLKKNFRPIIKMTH